MDNSSLMMANTLSRRQWLSRMSLPAAAALAFPGIAQADSETVRDEERGTHVYNVRSFGAKGDGRTLDTHAVQEAIDACTRDGGGIVVIPPGIFQIGTVELKSNVTLRVTAGAKLLGSADGKPSR